MTMTIESDNKQGPQQFIHKPIPVEAMQVSPSNIYVVAQWCGGKVKGETVRLRKPQSKSDDPYYYIMVGNYVVLTASGYMPMTRTQFEARYVPGGTRLKEN